VVKGQLNQGSGLTLPKGVEVTKVRGLRVRGLGWWASICTLLVCYE